MKPRSCVSACRLSRLLLDPSFREAASRWNRGETKNMLTSKLTLNKRGWTICSKRSVVELEARVQDVEMKLGHSLSLLRAAESNYLLLYNQRRTLKRQLSRSISFVVEMERCIVNENKDGLGYMDVLHWKAMKVRIPSGSRFVVVLCCLFCGYRLHSFRRFLRPPSLLKTLVVMH